MPGLTLDHRGLYLDRHNGFRPFVWAARWDPELRGSGINSIITSIISIEVTTMIREAPP